MSENTKFKMRTSKAVLRYWQNASGYKELPVDLLAIQHNIARSCWFANWDRIHLCVAFI